MTQNNDITRKRKERLLLELESIKYLLDENKGDAIPVLDDAIIEEDKLPPAHSSNTLEYYLDDSDFDDAMVNQTLLRTTEASSLHSEKIKPVEEINHRLDTSHQTRVLPGQRSLFKESSARKLPAETEGNTAKTVAPKPTTTGSPLPKIRVNASLANNPFLPPHVRKRFEEKPVKIDTSDTTPAAQTSVTSTSTPTENKAIVNTSYTEQLVDQLIAHHLPKIEAELRSKLLDVVSAHNQELKK